MAPEAVGSQSNGGVTRLDFVIVGMKLTEAAGVGESVYGYLSVLSSMGLRASVHNISSLADVVAETKPRAVLIGPSKANLDILDVVEKNPDTVFGMRTYTNIGVWESYGELGPLVSWVRNGTKHSNVRLLCNSRRTFEALRHIPCARFFPNICTAVMLPPRDQRQEGIINVAWGGRPDWTKNIPVIALAAMSACRHRELRMHVWEGSAGPNTGNRYGRWFDMLGDRLIRHAYADGYEAFRNEMRRTSVDVFVHPSLSESYCFSAADALTAGFPVVGSRSIEFLPDSWKVRDLGNATETAAKILALASLSSDDVYKAQEAFCVTNRQNTEAVCEVLAEMIK